jgi:SAM-dependent methyltransferase
LTSNSKTMESELVQFQEGFADFAARHDLTDWEGWWSPYCEKIYRFVLDHVLAEDIVLEIGAGDLRLALRLAQKARRVYAVEVNPCTLGAALAEIGHDMPRELIAICGNALDVPFPPGVTVAVLLMRHCQHFARYVVKLREVGCRRLITNARWGMGVEVVDLSPGAEFTAVKSGWYACKCGAVGFVTPADISTWTEGPTVEVEQCPRCMGDK